MKINIKNNIKDTLNKIPCIWQLNCYSVGKPCPTLHNPTDCSTPGFHVLYYLPVCSNSYPLSQWCYLTISSLLFDYFFFSKKWNRVYFLFIYFNWMRITLQYYSVFLPYIDMNQPWLYMCSSCQTPLPPLSPPHLSGSSQCISPEHPVSFIEPGLSICFTYDNIHVSMLFSQIIPPSPSPTEFKRLFYTSVSLLLSHT